MPPRRSKALKKRIIRRKRESRRIKNMPIEDVPSAFVRHVPPHPSDIVPFTFTDCDGQNVTLMVHWADEKQSLYSVLLPALNQYEKDNNQKLTLLSDFKLAFTTPMLPDTVKKLSKVLPKGDMRKCKIIRSDPNDLSDHKKQSVIAPPGGPLF
jgi:hypothetical protein